MTNNLAKCFSLRRVWRHSGFGIIENTSGDALGPNPKLGSECTVVLRDSAPGWAAPSRQPQTPSADFYARLSLRVQCGLVVLLPSLVLSLPPLQSEEIGLDGLFVTIYPDLEMPSRG